MRVDFLKNILFKISIDDKFILYSSQYPVKYLALGEKEKKFPNLK